jgi:hypothetical protein
MGAITRSIANNITTSGVFTSSAIDNSSVTGITTLANVTADGITFISSQTASNSASLSFTSGLSSTYKAYKFVFADIHARTNGVDFEFNLSTDSGSNYNVTKTTTFFYAYHQESGANFGLAYEPLDDLAQSTGYQTLTGNGDASGSMSNDADSVVSGSLTLFNPSSTTYVKHFISCTTNPVYIYGYMTNGFMAGYGNTTSAVNAIQFRVSSGNFDGTVYLYGIK